MLVMDEPTNDLDIETLELLEELLSHYQGTLLLVSHDRKFLDEVITSALIFEGQGKITDYAGGYEDWLAHKNATNVLSPKAISVKPKPIKTQESEQQKSMPRKKLSYKEQKELNELPAKIEALEEEQARLQQQMTEISFYQQEAEQITKAMQQLKNIDADLQQAYLRWEALEKIATDTKSL
jgi:ATP-binding cassette subfamily F protein uup